MYIVLCGTINKDVNSIRINTNNSHLFPSFALAEKEAKSLTKRHGKKYYVLSLVNSFDVNNVIIKEKI